MTDDDKRRQWMDIFTARNSDSDAPSVTDPSATNTQAAQPDATQALLQDQFGTGFVNYGQQGQGNPYTQQFQPIPNSSGSLYDPNAPAAGTPFMSNMPQWPGQTPPARGGPYPPPDDSNPYATPNQGPVNKPFRLVRTALGYRGGEY